MVNLFNWLKRLIISFFGAALPYLASFSVAKWGVIITVFTTALLALWNLFLSLRNQIFKTLLPTPIQIGFSAVIPDNFELALSVYSSAYISSWVFTINKKLFFENIWRLTHFGGRPK